MYSNILVPLDGSELAESALVEAVKLVQGLAGRVTLVRVVDSARPFYFPGLSDDGLLKELRGERARVTYEARAYLETVCDRLKKTGAQVGLTVLEGAPGPALLELAQEAPADLIVMATHGRSGLSRLLLGSVAAYVVAHSTCPVLVVPSKAAEESEVVRLRREVDRQARVIEGLRDELECGRRK